MQVSHRCNLFGSENDLGITGLDCMKRNWISRNGNRNLYDYTQHQQIQTPPGTTACCLLFNAINTLTVAQLTLNSRSINLSRRYRQIHYIHVEHDFNMNTIRLQTLHETGIRLRNWESPRQVETPKRRHFLNGKCCKWRTLRYYLSDSDVAYGFPSWLNVKISGPNRQMSTFLFVSAQSASLSASIRRISQIANNDMYRARAYEITPCCKWYNG